VPQTFVLDVDAVAVAVAVAVVDVDRPPPMNKGQGTIRADKCGIPLLVGRIDPVS
jgi:hypothetical protein